jgi:2-phospho-L-lactate guanylyltransferase (CobY/MobA/RfbA family)
MNEFQDPDCTPKQLLRRKVRKAMKECAMAVQSAVVVTMDDLPTDDNQAIADVTCETIESAIDKEWMKRFVHRVLGTTPK